MERQMIERGQSADELLEDIVLRPEKMTEADVAAWFADFSRYFSDPNQFLAAVPRTL
jgi:hypothetical protein